MKILRHYRINKVLFILFFIIACLPSLVKAQSQTEFTPTVCNTPLVGPGRVINNIPGSVNVLSGPGSTLDNLIDGDLSNFSNFPITLSLLTDVDLISIRDVLHYYPAGTRTGFVVQGENSLLDLSAFSGLTIRTYLNGMEQETVTNTNTTLAVDLLGGTDRMQRISFVTTLPFDEIKISQTGLLTALGSLNIYYAFVEPQNGCDYSCVTPVTSDNFSGISVTRTPTNACLLAPICVENEGYLINSSLDDNANVNILINLGGTATFDIDLGTNVINAESPNARTSVGVVIGSSNGLLNVSLLGGISITTFLSGTQQETYSFGSLANISILSDGLQALSFTATKAFDEIRIGVTGTVLMTYHVYYAFIQPDSDGDGFVNCVDKCAGQPDYLDADGDGIPDGCDTDCSLNLGADIYLCAQETTYDFGALGLGNDITWTILPESTSGATVTAAGLVEGMNAPGVYYIQISNASGCTDVVTITKRDPLENLTCNVPIIGPGIEIFDPSGGGCLICLGGSSGNPDDLIDNDLSNYMTASTLLSILNATPLIGVHNTFRTYPAGTRTGFAVKMSAGLIDATLLSNLSVKTYLNGVEQETGTGSTLLLSADVLSGNSGMQRIGFVTSMPFDAVALFTNGALSLATNMQIYYAYEESGTGCGSAPALNCMQTLTASGNFNATFEMNHTGYFGVACIDCDILNLGNMLDNDEETYATISQSIGLGSSAAISVKTNQTIGTKYQAGFIISSPGGLLDVNALSNLTITTYYNGVEVDNYTGSNALVGLSLLDANSGKSELSFVPTAPFNEIQISSASFVNALSEINVYGAFVRSDSDEDGVPDCMDRCCGNPDYIVNPDGIPSACAVTTTDNASCTLCPLTITLSGAGLLPGYTYALYEGSVQIGVFVSEVITFTPSSSGMKTYTISASMDGVNYSPVKDLYLNIHPAAATWTPIADTNTSWGDGRNWTPDATDTGSGSAPNWCTDVTIPGDAISFPILQVGDQCRDILFKNNASVGKIMYLKYRHARVEYNPARNIWNMVTSPLRYMFSADYGPDASWGSAIEPKVFMRHYDTDYKTGTDNPDGVAGTSVGNFSRAFASLTDPLSTGIGFVTWTNGSPDYPDTNFPNGEPFKFPRVDAEGNDVMYSMHLADGSWFGDPFYVPERGNDIKLESEWTAASVPDRNNRYRFSYDRALLSPENLSFTIALVDDKGQTEMVGNPFMSHLDFNQFYNDNSSIIYNYFRVWDGIQFYSYIFGAGTPTWQGLEAFDVLDDITTTQYISPMQGFFIEVRPDAPTYNLTFTNAASTSETGNTIKNAEEIKPEILKLGISSEGGKSYAAIAVLPEASNDYIPGEDISKLFSPFTDFSEVYTVVNNKAMEINALNNLSEHLIPIGIKTDQIGNLELEITGSDNLLSYADIKIIDKQENREYDLKNTSIIPFTKSTAENLEGRFYVSLLNQRSSTGINESGSDEASISILQDGNHVTVTSNREDIRSIQLYNYLGQPVFQNNEYNSTQVELNLNEKGVFIMKVETANTKKIIKLNL